MSAEEDPPVHVVYVVFAQVHHGVSEDCLAVYSSLARAQIFMDSQDGQLRQCLIIREIEIDRDPSDPYWKTPPQGMSAAFDLLAGMPSDAMPEDRGDDFERLKLGSLVVSIDREAGRPDAVVRVDSDGTRTVGHMIDGQFVPEPTSEEQATADLLLRVLHERYRQALEGESRPAAEVLAQLRARLNAPDEHKRLTGVMTARGQASVPPIAGSDPTFFDLQLVLAAAEALTGGREHAQTWLDVPLAEYDDLTPRQLVDRGRADTVLRHIGQLMSGSSG